MYYMMYGLAVATWVYSDAKLKSLSQMVGSYHLYHAAVPALFTNGPKVQVTLSQKHLKVAGIHSS